MIEHLYIHVPFCKKKCPYCNFVSYEGMEEKIDEYVEGLKLEIRELETIYLGGGTPSLLTPKQVERILNPYHLILNPDTEATIECNPGTADLEKLSKYRKLGVNRLSIGGQSFQNKHLKTLGRIHSAEDLYQTFKDARSAGFNNIGIDIMYALPGQTFDDFKKDIEEVLKLDPEHISLYNLDIHENPTYHLILNSYSLSLPDNDTEADMFEYAIDSFTTAGYKHYEISNFAKHGKECRHNIAYWLNKNYLGVGDGAHSHVDGKRSVNGNSIECDEKRETIFMGLRLLDGISKDKFMGFGKEVAELKKQGLLEETGKNIKLTKKGLFLANSVFEKFV